MKNIKTYAGIALTTLALPILSNVTGLSKHIANSEIADIRESQLYESKRNNVPNNYEAHYLANEKVYNQSANAGVTGAMALLGFAGATNFVLARRKKLNEFLEFLF